MAIAMALVSILAAGAGAMLAFVGAPPEKASSAQSVAAEVALSVYDLAPIVTNLASPQNVWARLEISLVVDPHLVPNPSALGGELTNDILAYLRTVTLEQIDGPSGLLALREALNERAKIRSNGKINEVILKALVVQ